LRPSAGIRLWDLSFSGPEILRDIIDSMQSASGLRDSFEAVGQYLHNTVGLMDAKVGR
jgi:hypothetical protein